MNWNEVNEENDRPHPSTDMIVIGRHVLHRLSNWQRADLLACVQAHALILAVTLLLLLEDDAAMLACMFC